MLAEYGNEPIAYVIAFAARRDEGLQDCNVSGLTNLCQYGATYIRNNMQRILDIYANYARGYASCWGTSRPIIFLMEPDYYQYHSGGDANALSPQEAGQFMGQIVSTMRQHLPNAVFSLDTVGVMSVVSATLAEAAVPIMVFSSHATDHLLVPELLLGRALTALGQVKLNAS